MESIEYTQRMEKEDRVLVSFLFQSTFRVRHE